MGKCRHFLYGVVAVLLVLTLTVTACALAPTPTPDKTPAPAPAPAATITRDQASIMVIERLTNLAQTSEAKEYVTIFLKNSTWEGYYSREAGAYSVIVSPSTYDLIKQADWFNVTDVDYFFDVHWDEPGWLVHDDGKISPAGAALMVEDDVEQLNTARVLE